jgi:Flp pilus assembly protein TadD
MQLLEQGLRLQASGNLKDAEVVFRSAVVDYPEDADAAHLLGVLLSRNGKTEEAIATLQQAMSLAPGQAEIHLHLGNAFQAQGMYAQAEASYVTAVRLGPKLAAAHVNLVSLMRELGRFGEAQSAVRHALSLNPESAELWQNLGSICQELALWPEAIAAFDRAIEIDPKSVEFHYSMALALLASRQFERGWREYESRFQLDRWDGPRQLPNLQVWRGEPVEGTLLVYGEQGIGDEIMFASCVPDVQRCGQAVILACSSKLEGLFRRSFPSAEVICLDRLKDGTPSSSLSHATAMIASGSLPRIHRHTVADFPRHRGYLVADESQSAAYRARLEGLGSGLKVGLSWRGGTERTRSSHRSLKASDLEMMLQCPGVRFVNLQYDSSADDAAIAAAIQAGKLVHWPDALQEYDRTAALVSGLDVIVSVCTSVIHLSGALGRPTIVMAPHSAEWRYGMAGEDMPWYPSVHIERQSERGVWATVIEAVHNRLKSGVVGD